MRIFNFGSLNLDHVYSVDDFVQPGQTIAANDYRQFAGGKGLNQSIALAKAGADVVHVGMVGIEGGMLLEKLQANGVAVDQVVTIEQATGQAVIQVNNSGENAIIINAGANACLSKTRIDEALNGSKNDDWVLCQNETSEVAYLLDAASRRGLFTVFNPAPMTTQVHNYPLAKVDLLIVNETEAQALVGAAESEQVIEQLLHHYPATRIVLTLGAQGAVYADQHSRILVPAHQVQAVDTTAAGDTFIGYFVAQWAQQLPLEQCLEIATQAAALCVQTQGAADSIPDRAELNL